MVAEDLAAEESTGRTRAEIALEEALAEMGELTAQLDEIDRRFQSRKDFDCQTEGVLSSQIKTETVVSPLGDEPVGEEDILDEKVRRALVGGCIMSSCHQERRISSTRRCGGRWWGGCIMSSCHHWR